MRPLRGILCGLLVVLSPAFAQVSDPALAEGLRLLEEGRTTLETKPLLEAKFYLTRLAQNNSNNALYLYHVARVNHYLAESYAARRNHKDAQDALEEAIKAIQQAISLNGKSADAHSLLADLYGRKIGFGGFFAGARYGPKVSAENKQALALEAGNPQVFASLGRQYLHAPKMFGGNVDKAIDNFRKATQLDAQSDENFVWLALAYRKKGDTANADKALQEALRLNPRSSFAQHVQRSGG